MAEPAGVPGGRERSNDRERDGGCSSVELTLRDREMMQFSVEHGKSDGERERERRNRR